MVHISRHNKNNQAGFAHIALLLTVIIAVALLGCYMLVRGHADSPPPPTYIYNADGTAGAETPAADSLRIATYNIKSSNFSPKPCSQAPVNCTVNRAQKATDVIEGDTRGDARTEQKPFDVVGVQEMQQDQFTLFDKDLPGYGHYPVNAANYSGRTVYYRTSRLKLLDAGAVTNPFNRSTSLNDYRGNSIWLKLEDRKTHEIFYVMNTHMTINALAKNGPNGALIRERTARILRDWINTTKRNDPNVPIFLTGDLNSSFLLRPADRQLHGDRSRLPYCILTSGASVQHVFDRVAKKSGDCPTNNQAAVDNSHFAIDHIFIYGNPVIHSYTIMGHNDAPHTQYGSDHAPVFIDVTLGALVPTPDLSFDNPPVDPKPAADDVQANSGYAANEFSD